MFWGKHSTRMIYSKKKKTDAKLLFHREMQKKNHFYTVHYDSCLTIIANT